MIFTLGHSTLERHEFVRAARGIDVIVDTRSHPGSKRVPHFNKEEMEEWLPVYGLEYEWWPELGGWTARHMEIDGLPELMAAKGVDIAAYSRGAFPKQRIGRPVDREPGQRCADLDPPQWTNQGLYDYAWYTALLEFQEGVHRLVGRFGAKSDPKCAIICCEACWWKCHRSMIADNLVFRDVFVGHLPVKPPVRMTTRRFKPHAEAIGNRLERYPSEVMDVWRTMRELETLAVG